MKSIISLFLVLTAGIVFFACNKKVAKEKEPAAYLPVDFKKANVGGRHNLSAIKLIERYEEAKKSRRLSNELTAREIAIEELKATPVDLSSVGITKEDFITTITQINDDLDAVGWDARRLPMPLNRFTWYIREVISAVESNPTQQEIASALNVIRQNAANELGAIEYDKISALIEVGKASAWLWSDDDGNFVDVIPGGRVMCCSGRKALMADVGSLATSMIRMGVVGVVFASAPGSNVVMFTGLAVGAGVSSGLAALLGSNTVSPAKRKFAKLTYGDLN